MVWYFSVSSLLDANWSDRASLFSQLDLAVQRSDFQEDSPRKTFGFRSGVGKGHTSHITPVEAHTSSLHLGYFTIPKMHIMVTKFRIFT